MESLSIGQVARRAGVSVDTIRFYERQGVLEKPPRRDSGYRQYSEEVVRRLRFIQCVKQLGFTLKEITDLLTLRVDAQTTCFQVKEATLAKLDQVERKLVELEHMRRALLQVASLCTGAGPASACPLLDALDQDEPLEATANQKEETECRHPFLRA